MSTLSHRAGSLSVAVMAGMFVFSVSAWGQTAAVDDASPDNNQPAAASEVQVTPVAEAGQERFVARARISALGTLEIRHDAIITGPDIKLRQVCRWAASDSASFAPIGDLVIDKLISKRPKKITLDQLENTLRDAGVNQGLIKFTGSTSCLVSASEDQIDVSGDDRTMVNTWLDRSAKRDAEMSSAVATPTAYHSAANDESSAAPSKERKETDVDGNNYRTLRDCLLADLSERLNIPAERLQFTVDGKDSNLLNLSEPTFHFDLQPRRVRDLGRVSWDVSIVTGRSTQTVSINGEARAWEKQIIIVKPVTDRQVLQATDVTERRVLMDHVDDDPVLTRQQVLGQQASRELKPGTVMTARLVESVPLARIGQFITITVNMGAVRVRTTGRALEAGSYGQSIKVKNEQSGETYQVTLTGDQTGVAGPIATSGE